MVFLCFSRVKIIHTAPLTLCSLNDVLYEQNDRVCFYVSTLRSRLCLSLSHTHTHTHTTYSSIAILTSQHVHYSHGASELRRGYRLGVPKVPAYLAVVPHYINLHASFIYFYTVYSPCIFMHRDARTISVQYEYMYRSTPSSHPCFWQFFHVEWFTPVSNIL